MSRIKRMYDDAVANGEVEDEGLTDEGDMELALEDAGLIEPDPDDYDPRIDFADPGGNSALRASSPTNPRIHPCPNCGAPNRLTPKDVALSYQCDSCADSLERGGP